MGIGIKFSHQHRVEMKKLRWKKAATSECRKCFPISQTNETFSLSLLSICSFTQSSRERRKLQTESAHKLLLVKFIAVQWI